MILSPHLDKHREDGVADDGDGRLHHVGEECGEGEAVRHVAASTVAVHLGNEFLIQWSASKIFGIILQIQVGVVLQGLECVFAVALTW